MKINTFNIYQQALDVLGASEENISPEAFSIKIQDAIDQVLTEWPVLDDGTGEALTLTNAREIRAFERGAGAEAAVKYLSGKDGGELLQVLKRRKVGDVEREWSNAPVPTTEEAVASARREKASALRRIAAIAGSLGDGVLFGRSGRYVEEPHEPRTIIDQAFGPEQD